MTKNRAQGAAALISNWGEVEKALVDAYDAENSAIIENEKYMDSLEGHIALMKNELQRLATTTIDADFLKVIVDVGKDAVTVINSLSDAFGGLNAVVGVAGGAIL